MTRTSEGLAAFVVDQLEELYRRMWVLRLLDMALEQLRIEGLINGPLQGGFGQEAVSVGAAAALGEGDVIITTHRPHAQHVGTDAPLGPVIADMLGATAGDLEGADEDAHIADPRAGLPAAIRVVKQSPLLAIGHAYALWLRDTGLWPTECRGYRWTATTSKRSVTVWPTRWFGLALVAAPRWSKPSPTAPPISLDLTAAAIATWPDPSSFWIR